MSSRARFDALIAANVAFDQVVADIQKIPGYADFLTEPTFAQIQDAAQNTPLIYLLATPADGLALVVHAVLILFEFADTAGASGLAYSDRSMLIEHFYRGWREARLPPAQALRAAQRWLRDTTNREKAEYFQTLHPRTAPYAHARSRGHPLLHASHDSGPGPLGLYPPLLVGRLLSDGRLATVAVERKRRSEGVRPASIWLTCSSNHHRQPFKLRDSAAHFSIPGKSLRT